MDNIVFPTHKFDLIENKVASRLYGLTKSEAIREIQYHDLVARVLQEDKKTYKTDGCYVSSRINIYLQRNRVTNVAIG